MIIKKKYWNIAKRLTTAQLQKESDADLLFDESDLFNVNIGRRGNNLFLGFYSREGLRLAFEKYSVFGTLRDLGFTDLLFLVNTDDPYLHKLSIYDGVQDPEHLLIEVVLKRELVTINMPFETEINGTTYETLAIEWLCMQNPRKSFSETRPQLPAQAYPGLGMASKAVELLMITAWRLNLSGVVNTPQHYHNAYLYSRIFFYLNPEYEAMLIAMKRDMEGHPLNVVAWAIEWGAVVEKNSGKPLTWPAGKQIVPLNERLKDFFNSRTYRHYVKEKSRDYAFELDMEKYIQKRNQQRRINEA